MLKNLNVALFSAVFGVIVGMMPATAQSTSGSDQTVEEMTENFKKQKTRGLTIATPSQTGDTTTSSSGGTSTTAAADLNVVPKDEQVNVNVSFDFDSAALREDQKPKLVLLCSALKAADVQLIRILGHTDSSGSTQYNERLSKLRAEEVKRFLVADCGFPAERMQAEGVGERFPFDADDPSADVNRRVEFQALS